MSKRIRIAEGLEAAFVLGQLLRVRLVRPQHAAQHLGKNADGRADQDEEQNWEIGFEIHSDSTRWLMKRMSLGTDAGRQPPLPQEELDNFMRTRPLTIRTAAMTRSAVSCSPRTAMPTMKAPTAPMPVQIV